MPPPSLALVKVQLVEAEGVLASFEAALDSGLRQLCSELMPRIRPRLDAFGAASYTLQTEAAFAAAEGDTFVAAVMAEFEHTLRSLGPALVDGAREALLQFLIQVRPAPSRLLSRSHVRLRRLTTFTLMPRWPRRVRSGSRPW